MKTLALPRGLIVTLSILVLTAFLSACGNSPENTQTSGASSCFPQGTYILVSSTNDIPNMWVVEAKTFVMVSKSSTSRPCEVMTPFLEEVRNQYLSHDRSTKPELPLKSTPRDAPLYAQGYLDERQTLQPTRPSLPPDQEIWQFCWDYHQGRLLTLNIAGNDSRLPPGAQPGIKDRRAVTTEDPAGRPGPPSSKPA